MELKDLLGEAFREGMTVDEITAALKDVSLPEDRSSEIEKLKQQVSSANSEAAKYKKELNSKLSDQEIKDKEAAEQLADLQAKYDALFRETELAKNKAELIGLGYDEKLAEDTAKALLDGDTKRLFANQKKFKEALEKQVKDTLIKDTPQPKGGQGEITPTRDSILQMKDPIERQEAIAKNIDLFKE